MYIKRGGYCLLLAVLWINSILCNFIWVYIFVSHVSDIGRRSHLILILSGWLYAANSVRMSVCASVSPFLNLSLAGMHRHYSNETHCNTLSLILGPHDIFRVMRSKVKVTDNTFKKCTIPSLYRRRPSASVLLCFCWYSQTQQLWLQVP